MRTTLQSLEGIRTTFFATYSGLVPKKLRHTKAKKVLLNDVRDAQFKQVSDHVSTKEISEFTRLNGLKTGDLVSFTGIVRPYVKGYRGTDITKRLKHPVALDYTIGDIRDLRKINCEPSNTHHNAFPDFNELLTKKRITLGVH